MKYTIYTIVIMFSLFGFSQTCKHVFLGEINDFHDKTPIVDATIFIKNLNRYTTSDINGKFKIEKLCDGPLILEISHVNCENKTIIFNIKGDTFKTIFLEHHIEELNEITVNSQLSKTTTKTAQESIIKEQKINRYSSQSLGDALKEVSGVSSINTGNNIVKPIINGLHSSRLIILNNGVRLQDQEWGIEHAPNIDINAASQISVIKGSGALAYGGDAIGGVIVVKPSRVILKDTLYGKTILGGQTNGRGYNINTNLNKTFKTGWFANFQIAGKQNGDFEAPDYILSNTGSKSQSFTINGGKKAFESGFELYYSYLNNEIAILAASHIGSAFDLARSINSPRPFVIDDFSYDINAPKQEITHHLVKANYYKRFKNFGKLNLQYDYQYNKRLEFDVRRGDLRVIPAIDLTLQTHSFLADVNVDSNLNRKFNFGIVGRYQDNFADPRTGVRRLIPDYEKFDLGIYTTTEWRLKENLILDAGIRYDFNRIDAIKFYRKSRWAERGYNIDFADIIIDETPTQFKTNPVFNYHNFTASAGTKYNLSNQSYIIANYSLSSRSPNASELFSDGLHHSAARFELGDLRFTKEVANRFSASYGYNNSRFNFLGELFYNRIQDYIFLRPFEILSTNRGPFPLWEYQQTNAQLFGLDIDASYQLTNRFQLQNKTAFIKGKDLKNDTALIDIPPFSTKNKIIYNNAKWYNFSASLESEWYFQQNEFPDFNFDFEDSFSGERILVDVSTPPPAYHLLNFYSEATFSLGNKTNLNISFGVNNLFNTSYRNYLNQLRYFADDIGRNFTLQLQLNY